MHVLLQPANLNKFFYLHAPTENYCPIHAHLSAKNGVQCLETRKNVKN